MRCRRVVVIFVVMSIVVTTTTAAAVVFVVVVDASAPAADRLQAEDVERAEAEEEPRAAGEVRGLPGPFVHVHERAVDVRRRLGERTSGLLHQIQPPG